MPVMITILIHCRCRNEGVIRAHASILLIVHFNLFPLPFHLPRDSSIKMNIHDLESSSSSKSDPEDRVNDRRTRTTEAAIRCQLMSPSVQLLIPAHRPRHLSPLSPSSPPAPTQTIIKTTVIIVNDCVSVAVCVCQVNAACNRIS